MENKNPYGKFLKTSLLIGIGIAVFALGSIYFSIKQTGAGDIINQVFGGSFWFIVIGFVAFIILMIVVLQRWILSSLKPKDIPNGLPATATVIKSYQGNMRVSIGGVNQNYQLIIEVNVTNPQGETWQAKMEEMVNITQIGIFQPGVSFAVKYDPNNRSKVVIDQSAQTQQQSQQPFNNSYNIPGFGTVNSQMAQQAVHNQPQEIVLALQSNKVLMESLQNSGISATATVLSQETVQENFMPGVDVIKLRFRIEKTNYETEQLMATPQTSLYKSEPGKTIYVLFDPNNSKRVGVSGLDKPDGIVAL